VHLVGLFVRLYRDAGQQNIKFVQNCFVILRAL